MQHSILLLFHFIFLLIYHKINKIIIIINGSLWRSKTKKKNDVGENKELRNEFQIEVKSSQVKDEVFIGHKPIPKKLLIK